MHCISSSTRPHARLGNEAAPAELVAAATEAKPSPLPGSLSRRQRYRAPRLVLIVTHSDVLAALGPAQANYGSTGFP